MNIYRRQNDHKSETEHFCDWKCIKIHETIAIITIRLLQYSFWIVWNEIFFSCSLLPFICSMMRTWILLKIFLFLKRVHKAIWHWCLMHIFPQTQSKWMLYSIWWFRQTMKMFSFVFVLWLTSFYLVNEMQLLFLGWTKVKKQQTTRLRYFPRNCSLCTFTCTKGEQKNGSNSGIDLMEIFWKCIIKSYFWFYIVFIWKSLL